MHSARGFGILIFTSLILGVLTGASAAEIRILSTGLMREALEDLSSAFERATGNKLTRSYATGSVIKERVLQGEVADLAILPVRAMEDLQRHGKTSQTDTVAVARSLIAVSVRAGATKPDISSVEALKQSLLAASSIVYFDPERFGF